MAVSKHAQLGTGAWQMSGHEDPLSPALLRPHGGGEGGPTIHRPLLLPHFFSCLKQHDLGEVNTRLLSSFRSRPSHHSSRLEGLSLITTQNNEAMHTRVRCLQTEWRWQGGQGSRGGR